eukprot:1247389-Lingulodinium_polyedra.AAC.1
MNHPMELRGMEWHVMAWNGIKRLASDKSKWNEIASEKREWHEMQRYGMELSGLNLNDMK